MFNPYENARSQEEIRSDSEIQSLAEEANREVAVILKKLEDAVIEKYGATMHDFCIAIEASTMFEHGNGVQIHAQLKDEHRDPTAHFGGGLHLDFPNCEDEN